MLGSLMQVMTIVPSPSLGTNSEPRFRPRIVVATVMTPTKTRVDPGKPQAEVQQRLEQPMGEAVDQRLPLRHPPGQAERGQHGHQRQRQDHRRRQGEDDRQGHRAGRASPRPLAG